MFVEILRIVRDALVDPAYGINAQLAALPLDEPGDRRPTPIQQVLTAADDDPSELDGSAGYHKLPALVIDIPDDLMWSGEVSGNRSEAEDVIVEIAYLAPEAAHEAQDFRDMSNTLRAVRRTLARSLLDADRINVTGRRNGVHVVTAHEMRMLSTNESAGNASVTGVLLMRFTVHDHAPSGA